MREYFVEKKKEEIKWNVCWKNDIFTTPRFSLERHIKIHTLVKFSHIYNTRAHSQFDWSVWMETAAACYTYTRSIHALDIFSFSLDAIQHWAVCFLLLFPFTLYAYIPISMYSRKIYIHIFQTCLCALLFDRCCCVHWYHRLRHQLNCMSSIQK